MTSARAGDRAQRQGPIAGRRRLDGRLAHPRQVARAMSTTRAAGTANSSLRPSRRPASMARSLPTNHHSPTDPSQAHLSLGVIVERQLPDLPRSATLGWQGSYLLKRTWTCSKPLRRSALA
jgi:hypothetical protein